METKTINVYKFDELKPEIQKMVIAENCEINISDEWYDYLIEDAIAEIKKKTKLEFNRKEINFNILDRCNNAYIDARDIINQLSQKYPNFVELSLPSKFGVYTNYHGGGISSKLIKSDFRMDFCKLENTETETVKFAVQEKLNEKILRNIKDDLMEIQDILAKLFNSLYEQYYYLVSDEAIKDTLIINEYEFLENGSRWLI